MKYFPFAHGVGTFRGNFASSERKVQTKSTYSFPNSQGLPRAKGKVDPPDAVCGLSLSLPVQEKSYIA